MFKQFLIAVIIFISSSVFAQKNITHAGKKGIWILCGTQLPKNFTYRILKQKGREEFKLLSELRFPKSKEEIQGEVLSTQQIAGFPVNSLSATRLSLIWQRLNNETSNELPVEMVNDYPLRKAIGTAFYDNATDSLSSYTYKVQIIGSKNEVVSETVSYQSAWPGKKPNPQLLPLSVKSINTSIVGEFAIINLERMYAAKVYRSYYLRTGFEEIQGEPIFTLKDSIPVIQFTDKTAVEKVPYTYVIVPIDAAGNEGGLSPELKLFNIADKTILPSVTNFKATSLENENAIKLSWTLKETKNMISIDIFKSDKYDGKYIKVATIPATDTTYLDGFARPIETYFYTVRINGTYEKSPLSPRIPGILKASKPNFFPPQNLRLIQEKNLVHLTWKRNEDDTRAYYVYRSTKRDNKMEQVGKLIITDSATISYTDTIPATAEAGMYAYAIADQNTSYAISSLTEPVFAYTQGINATPIPHDLVIKEVTNNHLQVLWANMLNESKYFLNYHVYRRAVSLDGTKNEPIKQIVILNANQNTFIDSTTVTDMVYHYSIKTVSDQGIESSPSLETGYTIQSPILNNVGNIRVFSSADKVFIKWDNPINNEIKNIRLIRITEGNEKPNEIALLDFNKQEYTDTDVKKGSSYYYQLQVVDKKGNSSKLSDQVGVKIY
ncbi:MAG: hypothetical protein EOP00_08885 [Pedobacter sp.]|nr:MAG: hypothetical protein EOP00_08885 [Pedobacter sp.]